MLFAVVQHVAALAKRTQISWTVVAGIVVEVCGGQKNFSRKPALIAGFGESRQRAAAAVAPYRRLLIPPAAVAKIGHFPAVGAAALLTAPLRPTKADRD